MVTVTGIIGMLLKIIRSQLGCSLAKGYVWRRFPALTEVTPKMEKWNAIVIKFY